MTIDEFKEYIDSIANTEEFKEIADFIKLSDYDGENLAEKIMSYLSTLPYSNVRDTDTDYFIEFFERYKRKEYEAEYTNEGFVNLNNSLYLIRKKDRGYFNVGSYIFPDKTIFFAKRPLSELFWMAEDVMYDSVIASSIAKAIGVNSAEYILGINGNNTKRILSRNFLNSGEELNTFYIYDINSNNNESKEICTKTNKISEVLDILERSLVLRNYPAEEIEQAKFDFLKQEFFAKIIGLADQNSDNTGIITSVDNSGQRHVRLAPTFDFDFSFNNKTSLPLRLSDNLEIDIASLIKQYKDYPGFMEFVKTALQSFSMDKVYETIYADTGLLFFENYKENSKLKKYTDFVNKNIELAKETVVDLEQEGRTEDKSFETSSVGEFC